MAYSPKQYGFSGFGDAANIVNEGANRRANILGTTTGYSKDLLNSLIGGIGTLGGLQAEDTASRRNAALTRENFAFNREQNELDRKSQLISQLIGANQGMANLDFDRSALAEGSRQFDLGRTDENSKFALARQFDETKLMAEEERFKKELENRQREEMINNFYKDQGLALDQSQVALARDRLNQDQEFSTADLALRQDQFGLDQQQLEQQLLIAKMNADAKNADDNVDNANAAYDDPTQASLLGALDPASRAAAQSGIAGRTLLDVKNAGRSALENNFIGRGQGFSPNELLDLQELINKQMPALEGSQDPNVAILQQILSGVGDAVNENSPKPIGWFDVLANNMEKLFTNTNQIPQDKAAYIRQLLGI